MKPITNSLGVRVVAALLAAAVGACSEPDQPASGPVDGASDPDTLQTEDGSPAAVSLSGFVALAGPVAGASVQIRDAGGQTVATATTGTDGFFLASMAEVGAGPIQIRVFGATAIYLEVDGATERGLDSSDLLTASLDWDPAAAAEGISVNALTTLVDVLAAARSDQGAAALAGARQDLTAHFSRPETFVPVSTPTSSLAAASLSWPGPRAASALFHAGLSRLALDLDVGTADLVEALGQDLSDGVFDGQIDGADVHVLGEHALEADTTRWILAAATDSVVDDPSVNQTAMTYAALAADGGYYTLISSDDGVLYPADAPWKRFDESAPALTFVAPTPVSGAFVGDSIELAAQAEDDSELISFDVDSPAGAQAVFTPPATLTAILSLADQGDGPLVVVIRAEDASGNVATESREFTIDQTPPQVTLVVPDLFNDAALELTGQAVDTGSGMQSVTVDWQAVALADDGTFEVAHPWVEGTNYLTVRGYDGVGNEAIVMASGILDTTPPIITWYEPEGPWLGEGPMLLSAGATDSNGVAALTANGVAFVAGKASLEPPVEDGPVSVTVTAADHAGNATDETRILHYDSTGPLIDEVQIVDAVESKGLIWVTADKATIQITVTDAGAGVASVCVGDLCTVGAALPGDTWPLVVTGLVEGSNGMTLTATDTVGNTSTLELIIGRDTVPPACILDTPEAANAVVGALWFGQGDTQTALAGSAPDAGVGLAAVAVTLGGEPVETTLDAAAGWSTGPFALAAGTVAMTVVCEDLLGNESPTLSTTIRVDYGPPALTLMTSTFVDETHGSWTYLGAAGAAYALPDGEQITVSAGTCPADDCGGEPWPIFANRLWETNPNLPAWTVLISDTGAAPTPAGQVAATYVFERAGEPLTEPHLVPPGGVIRVAIDAFASDPAGFQWSPELVPDSVTIEMTDYAGNSASRTFGFDLLPMAPPVFVLSQNFWPEEAYDLTYLELGGANDKDLAAAFSPDQPPAIVNFEGIRFGRFTVVNPHDVSVSFEIAAQLETEASWTEQQVFIPLLGSLIPCGQPLGCSASDLCNPGYQKECIDPEASSLTAGAATLTAEFRVETPTLAPGGSTSADVLVKAFNTCLIGDGQQMSGVGVNVAGGSCETGGATAGFTARCQGLSGPPLYLCHQTDYHTPEAVTSFTLATESIVSLNLKLTGFVSNSYQSKVPLAATKTVSASLEILP